LTHLIRYIHLNPVQANLVEDPHKYPWSSHKAYLKGKNETPWLYVRLGLAFFSNKLTKALKRYREFMKNGIDPRTKAFYDKKHQSPIFGDSDFSDRIKEKYLFGNQKLSTEIPDKRKMEGATIATRILKETARSFKKPQEALTTTRRGERNEARSAALLLTRELSGLRLSEIAPIFKTTSYKTVSTGCHRFKARLAKDSRLKRQYDQLSQRCSQGEI